MLKIKVESHFYTAEEAFARFQEVSELYGHLAPVHLYFFKGDFEITYSYYDTSD